MEKMMRKLTALIMVLSLLAGTMALPAAATETGQEEASQTSTEVSVTVEIKDSEGTVIGEKTTTTITDSSGEVTGKTTVSTTTSTGSGGEQITQQNTTSTAATENGGTETQTAASTTTTTTEVADTESGYTKTTDTDTVWKEETVEKDPSTTEVINDSTTQTIEVSTTTVTEGSQEQTDIVDRDSHAGETHYSGSTEGSETTTITDTTTTTTVTTDAELTSTTEVIPPSTETNEGSYTDPAIESSTPWARDADSDVPGQFTPVPGTEQTTQTTETRDVVTDPLAGNTDVTLQMNAPATGTTTDTETVTLSGDKALEDVIPSEGLQADGSTVTYQYQNGVLVGYTVTRHSAPTAAAGLDEIQVNTTTDPALVSETEDVYILPTGYTEGTETSTIQGRDGQTTIETTTVTTALEDGTGYRILTTQVVTAPYDGELEDLTGNSPEDFVNMPTIPEDAVWTSDEQNSYIQLPRKPEPATSTDETGVTTAVTVEEILDSQTKLLIGYKTTTTVTNPDGTLISRSSASEYGTITSFSTTIARDPDTQQITTVTESTVRGLQDTRRYTSTSSGTRDLNTTRVGQEDVYQLVETDSGLVFIYNGTMYAVEGTSTLRASTDVATGSTVTPGTFTSGGSDSDLRLYGEALPNNTTSTVTDYYTNQRFKATDTYKNGTWTHVGYGLFADFALKETDGSSHSAKQFMIQDGNEIRYVYCVELGAGIKAGSSYGSTKYTEDATDTAHPWNGADGTIGQIRSVALNGFWGTASGLGSLEAVKDLLRRNGHTDEADRLTAGMALTATQVAIWEFGAKDSGNFGGKGHNFVTWDDGAGAAPDENTWKTIVTLRDLLVDLAKNPQKGQAEIIDASDVKSGAITLKERVSQGSNGTDVFNTDVSFTLDVSTSSINGDLIVTVYTGGTEVGKARLAGNEDAPGLFRWGKIYPDSTGTYTITDLELAEGVKVDLKLSGTQHLDDGVYVFKGEGNMQDFVGLSRLEQDVDLTISMEFNAVDPDMTLNHTKTTWTEKKTDKEAYLRTNHLTSTRSGTETSRTVTVTTKLYGTNTQTDVATAVTTAHRDWEHYYSYTLSDPAEGGSTQPDDAVEKADAPKTGDSTALLALISLFSAGGYVLLNRKKEEE